MQIPLKDAAALEKMRQAGAIVADILDMIGEHVKSGITTEYLNQICHQYATEHHKVKLACLGYGNPPFPKATCISVNHVICHGIPSSKKILKNGDIVNIDITIIKDGYHGDSSRMYIVGQPSILAQKLIDTTYQAMWLGIKAVKPNNTLADIARAIQIHAEKAGFSVVREFCGHGIGIGFHEDPQILHYVDGKISQQNTILKEGMVFTIEPMINAGKPQLKILPDKWTAVTKDRSLSAQWEHMVAVTKNGYEVLTLSKKEKDNGIK